jgi:teichuronic acid biosynthesis glycosyltransferase TuaC
LIRETDLSNPLGANPVAVRSLNGEQAPTRRNSKPILNPIQNPLRIAVATHSFPSSSQPHRGRPIYEITKALSKMAEVQVFCVDLAYPRDRILRPRSFLSRDAEPSHSVPGVRVEYLRYSALPVVTRLVNGFNCGRVLIPRLRKFRPDLVIGYNVYPEGFGVVSAARQLGIPVLIGAIGSDVLRISGYFVGRLTAQTLRKASFVLTVSDDLRKRVMQWGIPSEKCQTILNGCDSDIFRPACRETARAELNIDPGAELVVFIGRFVPLKGLREFFEAAATLSKSRPYLQIVCIGEGPMDQELRSRAAQADLNGRVRFVAGASPHEIARWLAASNVFCLPSDSEGCPNVVIEALSCGRPVVASNVGGIPELLNSRCGVLVPPRDAQRLSQGLAQALVHPWDQEEIANQHHRGWDQVARETYQTCCGLVGHSELVSDSEVTTA